MLEYRLHVSAASPIPPARHPAALALAIYQSWQPYRLRGYLAGLVAGIAAGGIGAPLVTTSVTLLAAMSGVMYDGTLPVAGFVWTIVFALVTPATGASAYANWQPRDLRSAAQTYLWLAERAEVEWRAVTGRPTVPRDDAGMREFFETTPPTPANAAERAGLWLALLEIERARAAVAEMPNTTAADRFARESVSWLATFVAVGTPAEVLDALDALANDIEEPEQHLAARATVALQRARVALASGSDWRASLAAVRPALGGRPDAVYRRFVWRPAFRQLLIACVTGTLVYWAAWLLLAPYFDLRGALL